jgi:hypothetical protein
VLLIAGGAGAPDEIPTNRGYRDAGGPARSSGSGHTGGLCTHPVEYEGRTAAFLDRALGLASE